MKKNKIAFTMIELIVVTLIMALLTSSSVFYFFDFTDNRELLIQTDILQDDISDLDKQIKRFEISDYEMYFTAWISYYTGSINNLGTQNRVTLSLESSGTGIFSIPWWSGSWVWNYSIYENDKQISSRVTWANQIQEYIFDLKKNYSISGYVRQDNITTATNTIILQQLSSLDAGVELVAPTTWVFINRNNIKTPLSLEFSKWSSNHILELK